MIRTGTKVIVLASPLRKKIGPRKGSIGYVVQLDKAGKNIFYDSKEDVFVHLTKVAFTRYGFEADKRRMETKFFMNIFPSFIEPLMSRRSIDTRIAKVESIDIQFSSPFWAMLFRNVVAGGGNSIYSGILVPLSSPKANLLESDKREFETWLCSILMDYTFRNALSALAGTNAHLIRMLDPTWVKILRMMAGDKKYRESMLSRISIDVDCRRAVVSAIRAVMAIAYTPECRRDVVKTEALISHMGSRNSEQARPIAAGMLMSDLYSDGGFLRKVKRINYRSGKVRAMITHLSKVKKQLRCLAQALEDGQGEVGNGR